MIASTKKRNYVNHLAAVFPLVLTAGIMPQVLSAADVPQLISGSVNAGQLVTLSGNIHPLARPEYDHGLAPSSLPMERMVLVLKRSAQQQATLDQLVKQQLDPTSSNYHHWLSPQQFGQQFGLSDSDLSAITSWLEAGGFQIGQVAKGKTFIEFSGTAAQVQNTFHAPIHSYIVNGEQHWANASDPQIPAALAPAVAGVMTLHNFGTKTQVFQGQQVQATIKAAAKVGQSPTPQFSSGGSNYLAPGDYATIFNINPLYQSGINGNGVTVAVVGRTNINVQDVVSFRSALGLPSNAPQVVVNGTNPGDLGGSEELEAVLDTTWPGAIAPYAHVELVVSASTNSSDGVFLSENYIVDNNLGNVLTESFGDCEHNYTATQANSISATRQQAAAEGMTFIVSAGDSGSAGCDDFDTENSATGPVSVNVLASSPYDIAVGGTQFYDYTNTSSYWGSSNGSTGGSALSYIPEDVWNANCTGTSCGSGSILAGGGGASVYFGKPSWQSGVSGIPADGARDVPDVALPAAGHTPYLLCVEGSCTPNSNGQVSFYTVYGTSAAAPSFAGIMALINQKAGSRQGQAAPTLYTLAASENLSSCNASNTSALPASSCSFNDVTIGTNAVPGEANYNTSSEEYLAGVGYDRASGLGSMNVTALANGWSSVSGGGGGGGTTTYSISGQITTSSGDLSGVTVSLSTGASTTTDSSGDYSFSGLSSGASYTVTPSLSGYKFTPGVLTFPGLSSNQTANFVGTSSSTSTNVTKIGVFRTQDSNYNDLDGWYLDLNGNLSWDSAPTDSTGAFGVNGDTPVVGDWTHTGHTRVGVYRPSDSSCQGVTGWSGWYLDVTGDLNYDNGDSHGCFGLQGDTPIVGNWDGSGSIKAAVYRPTDSSCQGVTGWSGWYLDISGDLYYDNGDTHGCFGLQGDVPVSGNWDGSGKTKIGVFRSNDSTCPTGVTGWYLDLSGDLYYDNGDTHGCFGLQGDTPIVGDWNGSGKTKIGVFRPNDSTCPSGETGWYLDVNGDLTWDSGDTHGCFGLTGDTPVVGNWDGSAVTKIGVFRTGDSTCSSSETSWYLDLNGDLSWDDGDQHGCFGIQGDKPVVGIW